MPNNFLETLSYFDVQDHPLTFLELLRFHLHPQSKPVISENSGQLNDDLQNLIEQGQVATMYGYYFLPGRAEIARKRWRNNVYSTPRLKRATKYLEKTRHVPFIAAAALSGSEALNNSKHGSDIDILVLTEKNRIWLGRFFLTLYFQMTGWRRHGNLVADRFCLNHYVEKNKTLLNDQNLYTAIEYLSLIPFFGADEIYQFQEKNLPWIGEYLQSPKITHYQNKPGSAFKKSIEKLLGGRFGNWLESALGKYQLQRIKAQEHITVEKDELSFHPGSKGQQVLNRFLTKTSKRLE